jgi:hypothetical protein
MAPASLNEPSRRRLITVAGLSAGAALFARSALFAESPEPVFAVTQQKDVPANERGGGTLFAPVRQIDAGLLSIGYVELGPSDGPAALLLHGWPYDIHSFVDVAPLLAARGYRVIIPYLRGFGATRFLSGATLRNGQQSVLAEDIIHLMDALKIQITHGKGQVTTYCEAMLRHIGPELHKR